jgi:hypothetical protein
MGIFLFIFNLMKAVRGQKHLSEAKNGMMESIYWKKILTKIAKQPQKPLGGSNQIWAMTSGKKNTSPVTPCTIELHKCNALMLLLGSHLEF